MNAKIAMSIIALAVLSVNFTTMLIIFPAKLKRLYTIVLFSLFAAVHIVVSPILGLNLEHSSFRGIVFLPILLLLFKGKVLHKIFAFFLQYQFTVFQVMLARKIAGLFLSTESQEYSIALLIIVLLMFSVYVFLLFRIGRPLFKKLFFRSRISDWILYTLGAVFSYAVLVIYQMAPNSRLFDFILLPFIIWGFCVLCFAIIRTHEKAIKISDAETLELQLNAMRLQIEAENKYRSGMDILRHNMHHEMNLLVELFQTGKITEAEKAYAGWMSAMENTVSGKICAEPVLNAVLSLFERRAQEKGIIFKVKSQFPESLPVDSLKLAIVLSNALENALTATEQVEPKDERVINVNFIYAAQFGLEIINPCSKPVEFNEQGIPITHEVGRGVGVRFIAAFAEENNYLLSFKCTDGMYIMRLIMHQHR